MNIEIEQLLRLMKFYDETENEEDGELSEEEEALLDKLTPFIHKVDSSEEIDSKWVIYTNIYRVETEQETIFVDVTSSRSNSGYWSDGESGDTEVYLVGPKEIKKIIYTTKKPEGD